MARKSRKETAVLPAPEIDTTCRAGVYVRLSVEDKHTRTASIETQELLCKGWFLPSNTYDCGSFVVN